MSPARTGGGEIDLNRLVYRILLDVSLLRWFATTGGRGLAVLNAIVKARREGNSEKAHTLKFLEQHITTQLPDEPEPDDAA